MVRYLTLIAAGAFSLASVHAQLVLNPTIDEYELDGVRLKQLAFSDGGRKVTYQSPWGWEYSGSASQLILHPPKKTQASATITKIPLSVPGSFDEASVKKLVAGATAQIPSGSTNVTVVSQETNPLRINRKETFLVILSYDFFGENYNRSIFFVNREKEQIQAQLTCRKADFAELQKAFLGSQYTWQNL
jgi:hypothetical protein